MKTIYLTVKLSLREDVSPLEVIESLDYSFSHDGITEAEIVNACDEDDVDLI